MASVNVSIKTSKDYTTFKKSSQRHSNFNNLINLLSGLACGALQGNVYVSGSTSDPVAATATATITYASIANADTISLFGVTLTCVTGTPSTNEFKKQTDASVTAANLVTAANANSTIAKHCVASSSAGVVTFTLNTKGSIGNFLEDITKSSSGIALVQWAGGTGGVEASNETVR
jgi:hypothetical protein